MVCEMDFQEGAPFCAVVDGASDNEVFFHVKSHAGWLDESGPEGEFKYSS